MDSHSCGVYALNALAVYLLPFEHHLIPSDPLSTNIARLKFLDQILTVCTSLSDPTLPPAAPCGDSGTSTEAAAVTVASAVSPIKPAKKRNTSAAAVDNGDGSGDGADQSRSKRAKGAVTADATILRASGKGQGLLAFGGFTVRGAGRSGGVERGISRGNQAKERPTTKSKSTY